MTQARRKIPARPLTRRHAIVGIAATLALGRVGAQGPAGKPIAIKVAYAPGGPADVAIRKLQHQLQVGLAAPVVIENQPGATGWIAARAVLQAPPDGQTLLVSTGNDLILAPLTVPSAKYKPANFRLLTSIFPTDMVLVTSDAHAFPNTAALVNSSKAGKPLTAGNWGPGSFSHLVTEDFKQATGAKIVDIPYRGAAPIIQALLGHELDMAFTPMTAGLAAYIASGRLKALAVANGKRNPVIPNVPTVEESNLVKDFTHTVWAGIFVSEGVPEAVAARLSTVSSDAVQSPEFRQFLNESAAMPVDRMNLADAQRFFQEQVTKYTRLAKSLKLETQ
ncbi:tripartite tricarboxylate transporter substrate binding protein [Variovorax paradoxus]|nr:tripartite tricarboxylate transporter substrate binding protein [Variovorax paradoxus]